MEIERGLGFEPIDREFEKLGYDIESRVPGTGKLRFIEVKGRVAGRRRITVTKNEILYSLNKPEDFILAIVEFRGRRCASCPLPAPALPARAGLRGDQRELRFCRAAGASGRTHMSTRNELDQTASKDAGAPSENAAIPGGTPGGNAAIPGGTNDDPKGWYSRGYLPHLDQPGLYQSMTFRLHDSVPEQVIQRWKEELHWREDLPSHAPAVATLRQRIIEYEDAGHGACWLRDERIASLVENALLNFDGQRYRLIAWCIMPNHVHVLIETCSGYPLEKVLHSWKSFTAQMANKLLARNGPFWAVSIMIATSGITTTLLGLSPISSRTRSRPVSYHPQKHGSSEVRPEKPDSSQHEIAWCGTWERRHPAGFVAAHSGPARMPALPVGTPPSWRSTSHSRKRAIAYDRPYPP